MLQAGAHKNISVMSTCLTLFNTKRGTDLGTLVVPFDQTFHPLHVYTLDISGSKTLRDLANMKG